jgi:hypothetical protein
MRVQSYRRLSQLACPGEILPGLLSVMILFRLLVSRPGRGVTWIPLVFSSTSNALPVVFSGCPRAGVISRWYTPDGCMALYGGLFSHGNLGGKKANFFEY